MKIDTMNEIDVIAGKVTKRIFESLDAERRSASHLIRLVHKAPPVLYAKCFHVEDFASNSLEYRPGLFGDARPKHSMPVLTNLLLRNKAKSWFSTVMRLWVYDVIQAVLKPLEDILKGLDSSIHAAALVKFLKISPLHDLTFVSYRLNLDLPIAPYWSVDKLTKPILFVIDNANWSIRCSLLSAPIVPALNLSSKPLL